MLFLGAGSSFAHPDQQVETFLCFLREEEDKSPVKDSAKGRGGEKEGSRGRDKETATKAKEDRRRSREKEKEPAKKKEVVVKQGWQFMSGSHCQELSSKLAPDWNIK